jgi:2-iminobutanoate/2-iminopropanoate deaminase
VPADEATSAVAQPLRVPGRGGFSLSDAVAIDLPGRLIYVSGQIAGEAASDQLRDNLAAQADACFDQIAATLERCGASLAHVIRITSYVTTLADYASYNELRAERFGQARPASTTVQVAGLLGEGALIEIDAVAFVPLPGEASSRDR